MKLLNELSEAILNEDFYQTNQVIEKIKLQENAFEYIDSIFRIMESNPELDYGMPGPICHFVEKYYKKGYEELLLDSVKRFPTCHTVWMMNRIINDVELKNREMYINVLEKSLDRRDISENVREEIRRFGI